MSDMTTNVVHLPHLLPPPSLTHRRDSALDTLRQIRVAVIGAGGNGSQMISCLARMDRALRAFGQPSLDVALFDPDRVSPANVARQLFYPDDIGQSKAVALINRANLGFGLGWHAVPEIYPPAAGSRHGAECDILITCVDTGAARKAIYDACRDAFNTPRYWLDLGNEDKSGQVWLGQFPQRGLIPKRGDPPRLQTIIEAWPEWFDGTIAESDTPSCSLAEALGRQDLFVNDIVSRMGAHLLWRLLHTGEIDCQGYWINLADNRVLPVPIEAEIEKREAA